MDNPNIAPLPNWMNIAKQPRTFRRYNNVCTVNERNNYVCSSEDKIKSKLHIQM